MGALERISGISSWPDNEGKLERTLAGETQGRFEGSETSNRFGSVTLAETVEGKESTEILDGTV